MEACLVMGKPFRPEILAPCPVCGMPMEDRGLQEVPFLAHVAECPFCGHIAQFLDESVKSAYEREQAAENRNKYPDEPASPDA